jgi:hypothetical protein
MFFQFGVKYGEADKLKKSFMGKKEHTGRHTLPVRL